MSRKLDMRSFASDVINETLDRLESDGLLDQSRFAESFVRSRAGKGQGPLRIRQELTQRGVASSTITECLSIEDWYGLARGVRNKKFGPAMPETYKERARQMRFLQYRGFDSDHINAALDAGGHTD